MMITLVILTAVLVALATVTGLLYRSSRPKPKLPTATTTSTPSTPSGKKTWDWLSWKKFRDIWFPVIAAAAILTCWYLIDPTSLSKAFRNNLFLAGCILVAVSQFFLSVYAPFEKNRLRKLLLVVFFAGGIYMIAKSAFGIDVIGVGKGLADKLKMPSASSTTTTTMVPRGTIIVDIPQGKWSREVHLPPGAKFRTRAPEGRLKFLFGNGQVVCVNNNKNNKDIELGVVPNTTFRLGGPAGQAKVFIY